jgi:DNA-binding NtrC family response regulator
MCPKDFKIKSDSISEGTKKPLRILIYEPEDGNREVLCEVLKKDHEIVIIESIKNDLEIRDFDIIIIDPENGDIKELIHAICKRYPDKKFWIIVTSDKDEIELGLNKTTYKRLIFIPKPYDLDIVEKSVNKIVQWRAEEGEFPENLARKLARLLGFKL